MPAKKKRIYRNEKIEVDGQTVYFDGQVDHVMKSLRVFSFKGDINLQEKAFRDFMSKNGILKVYIY